jgi:hypothetical protein
VKVTASTANLRKRWQKTQFANLIRYIPSKTYFARVRMSGKLIRKSLLRRPSIRDPVRNRCRRPLELAGQ